MAIKDEFIRRATANNSEKKIYKIESGQGILVFFLSKKKKKKKKKKEKKKKKKK